MGRKVIGQFGASRPLAIAVACAAALASGLGGCASVSSAPVIDAVPAGILLPEGVPKRPAEPTAYPAVHDMPPPRLERTLSASEQKQATSDLMSIRDHQENVTGVAPAKK